MVKENKILIKKMAFLAPARRVDRWTVPPGFVPVQALLVYIMNLLENSYKNAILREVGGKFFLRNGLTVDSDHSTARVSIHYWLLIPEPKDDRAKVYNY